MPSDSRTALQSSLPEKTPATSPFLQADVQEFVELLSDCIEDMGKGKICEIKDGTQVVGYIHKSPQNAQMPISRQFFHRPIQKLLELSETDETLAEKISNALKSIQVLDGWRCIALKKADGTIENLIFTNQSPPLNTSVISAKKTSSPSLQSPAQNNGKESVMDLLGLIPLKSLNFKTSLSVLANQTPPVTLTGKKNGKTIACLVSLSNIEKLREIYPAAKVTTITLERIHAVSTENDTDEIDGLAEQLQNCITIVTKDKKPWSGLAPATTEHLGPKKTVAEREQAPPLLHPASSAASARSLGKPADIKPPANDTKDIPPPPPEDPPADPQNPVGGATATETSAGAGTSAPPNPAQPPAQPKQEGQPAQEEEFIIIPLPDDDTTTTNNEGTPMNPAQNTQTPTGAGGETKSADVTGASTPPQQPPAGKPDTATVITLPVQDGASNPDGGTPSQPTDADKKTGDSPEQTEGSAAASADTTGTTPPPEISFEEIDTTASIIEKVVTAKAGTGSKRLTKTSDTLKDIRIFSFNVVAGPDESSDRDFEILKKLRSEKTLSVPLGTARSAWDVATLALTHIFNTDAGAKAYIIKLVKPDEQTLVYFVRNNTTETMELNRLRRLNEPLF